MEIRNRIVKIIQVVDAEENMNGNNTDGFENNELQSLFRERSAQKDVIAYTIEVPAENIVLNNPTEEDKLECRALYETLCEVETEIKLLNDKIKPLIQEDNEYRNEIREQTIYSLKIKKLKLKLQAFVEKKNLDTELINSNVNIKHQTGVKLPKFILKPFSGDPLEWKCFEETFEVAVESNGILSEVEKFSYLRGYLQGSAFRAI